MTKEELISMKLHDEYTGPRWRITRVFGGWIYYNYYHDAHPVFVPESFNVYTKEEE